MLRKTIYTISALIVFYSLYVYVVSTGSLGRYEGPGQVTSNPVPEKIVKERIDTQIKSKDVVGVNNQKIILFGDLHVHTTYSADAFLFSLPMIAGDGTHPPADACDFARFCSSLDFWANTDHAEDLTPKDWDEIKESIQQCNEVSGEGSPDTIAFLGWEWSQQGGFGSPHYGHKNIILKNTDPDSIPTRPIASTNAGFASLSQPGKLVLSALRPTDRRVHDFMRYARDGATSACQENVAVRDLPTDCREYASDPDILFHKLNDWGHDLVVIPHGTSWGVYTPPESDWQKQLTDQMHDSNYQTMMEVYSGHGNSEEYRSWRSVLYDANGKAICPKPSKNYLPGCWQAGEIIRKRCIEEGESTRECEKRAIEARQNFADVGNAGQATVYKENEREWLNASQCQDCFLPTFNMKPKGSAQYILALRNFNNNEQEERFKFGFIGSSDTHTARPGNGYKEINRFGMTDSVGPADPTGYMLGFNEGEGVYGKSTPKNYTYNTMPMGPIEAERVTSFFYTGGLVATHSSDKSRDSIWRSIKNKEVYATSGPRILLWFDLLNGDEGSLPMGSETELNNNPRFIVKALGSFEQKPGCPDYAINSLGEERLKHLCKNECYNPSDTRRNIDRIEVIKITPQSFEDEKIDNLIKDPWKIYKCQGYGECVFTFSDKEYESDQKDAVYYVRAIEETSKAINAGNLRCEEDTFGNCKETNMCYGSPLLTPYDEDCLESTEERAWSSPIFVDYKEDS